MVVGRFVLALAVLRVALGGCSGSSTGQGAPDRLDSNRAWRLVSDAKPPG